MNIDIKQLNVGLKLVKTVKAYKELEELMRKGTVDEKTLVKMLRGVGLKKEQVDKIIEAKRRYDETGDEDEVIKSVAEAFGINPDVLEEAISLVSIVQTLL